MGAGSFFGGDVVHVGACETQTTLGGWATACALAAFLKRTKVLGVNGIADVEDAAGGDGVTEALDCLVNRGARDAKYLQQSLSATRSRTCRRPGRLTRPSLQGSPRP
jgi:hypothetical protein